MYPSILHRLVEKWRKSRVVSQTYQKEGCYRYLYGMILFLSSKLLVTGIQQNNITNRFLQHMILRWKLNQGIFDLLSIVRSYVVDVFSFISPGD